MAEVGQLINTYIQIPLADDGAKGYTPELFAADYLATTGEIWTMNAQKEEAGIFMLMGSTKCTEAMAIELQGRWPMMKYDLINESDGLPTGFVKKTEQ